MIIKHIAAVIFDLDGVLVDACEIHYQALNAALRKVAGYEISREDHESTFNGLPTKEKLTILEKKQIIREDQKKEIDRQKQKLTMYFIEVLRPDPEKIEMLRVLKSKGISVGLVTNCTRDSAIKMLTLTEMLPYFDCVITSSDGYKAKPDPEAYNACMRDLRARRSETMIIEDSPKGCEAAIRSGARILRAINKGPSEVTIDIFKDFI